MAAARNGESEKNGSKRNQLVTVILKMKAMAVFRNFHIQVTEPCTVLEAEGRREETQGLG